MRFTLDSNACIMHLRAKTGSSVSRRLAVTDEADIVITTIVRAELLYGALRSRDIKTNTKMVLDFLGRFGSISFDDASAEHYANIRQNLAVIGKPIGPNDLLIAAITRAHNLTLITHNLTEFSRVVGLRIEDWETP